MFENINSTFNQCLTFLAAGVLFGLCYEILRLLRMLFPHPTVLVFFEDTLFFAVCGLLSFIIAMWVGIGYFRIYYIAFEAIGALLYFLIPGRLINLCLRHTVSFIKKFFRKIYRKLKPKLKDKVNIWHDTLFMPFAKKVKGLFGKIAEFAPRPSFNTKKHLQSNGEMLYNNTVHTTLNSDEEAVTEVSSKLKSEKNVVR